MARALAEDFAALDGVAVALQQDHRLPERDLRGCTIARVPSTTSAISTFIDLSRAADWTVVIAPEFDEILASRCQLVASHGGRLLGPTLAIVQLCADKHGTGEYLRAAGVPAPEGVVLRTSEFTGAIPLPAVIKPRYGAGSQDMLRAEGMHELRSFIASYPDAYEWRVERHHEGVAVSLAVLCGAAEMRPLIPCVQHLSGDGTFQYRGGRLLLDESLATRATNLGLRAIASLDRSMGYLGVDMVLGEDPRGGDDVVVEINPRLTTSYVGLRRATNQNLAGDILALAEGRHAELDFEDAPVEFRQDGSVMINTAGTAV